MTKDGIKREQISQVLELIYIILFALLVSYVFLGNTMFEINWPQNYYRDLRVLILVVIFLRYGYSKDFSKKELLLIGILGVVFLLDYNRRGSTSLNDALLLILGARKISLRKLMSVFLFVTAGLLLFTNICSVLGVVDNLVYYQGTRHRRMSLGMAYPTNFAAHVFFCVALYIYLRGEQIKYIELAGLCGIGVLVYWLTDARTSLACIFLLIAVIFYHKVRTNLSQKKGATYQMNSVWSILLALSPVLCAGFMIVSTAFYSSDSKFWTLLNKILNSRLSLGHKAFEVYGFSFWGEKIPSTGNGGTTEELSHYFFLDSSYVRILMLYGLFVLICVLLIWLFITFSVRQKKEWILLWVLALVALQCMIEHHMLDVDYNPFLLCLLADLTQENSLNSWKDRKKLREKA